MITAANRVKAFVINDVDAVLFETGWQTCTIINSGLDRLVDECWWEQLKYAAAGLDGTAPSIVQEGLIDEESRTNDYAVFDWVVGAETLQSCDNLNDSANDRVLFRRCFDFATPVALTTYRECGISSQGSAGDNLFARALLPSIPVSPGRRLRLIFEVTLVVRNASTRSAVGLGISGTGWESTMAVPALLWWNVVPFPFGTAGYNASVAGMDDSADAGHAVICEPSRRTSAGGDQRFFRLFVLADEIVAPAWPDASGTNVAGRTNANNFTMTDDAYVPGSFEINYVTTIGEGAVTGIVRTLGISVYDTDDFEDHIEDITYAQHLWTLTEDRTKGALGTLVINTKIAWGRA
jgi:hypothetical protein